MQQVSGDFTHEDLLPSQLSAISNPSPYRTATASASLIKPQPVEARQDDSSYLIDPSRSFDPEHSSSSSPLSQFDELSAIEDGPSFDLPTREQPGILTLGLSQLFETVRQREIAENRVFIVRCSYFEIYNDQIYDLLQENFQQKNEPL